MARANNRGSIICNNMGYLGTQGSPSNSRASTEGQQRILIRYEENPTAIVEFSGLRYRGSGFNSGVHQPPSAVAQDGRGPSLQLCSASEYRQEFRAPHPVVGRIQFTLNV